MQEVAKVAGLVAVAAFLLWKVVRAHKRGCQKINVSWDYGIMGIMGRYIGGAC